MFKSDTVQTEEARTSRHSLRTTLAFSLGAMTDQMSHQMFQFLVFTYYYAIVGINLTAIAAGFVLFAIWDSLNDPLLGPISDRTKSKFGRRGFWIIVITIPFALVNAALFFPPRFWPIPITSDAANIAYMIGIIMLYDLFYTIFSANQLALFPEMFKSEYERARANKYKNIMTIVGVLLGFVLPTVLINPIVPKEDTDPVTVAAIPGKYLTTGILICVLVIGLGFLFFKFGMKEDPQTITKPDEMPGIWTSLKRTLKNKAFIIFVIANLFNWFIFKMLTTVIPLYGTHVLGIGKENSFLLTVLLLSAFLTAAACFPLMEWLGKKVGMRNGFIITEIVWIVAIIPFWFLDNLPYLGIVCMIFVGIGLSGAMYFVDIIIGRVIDEDEIQTGQRNQGAYYGVNALINRYSTILVFVTIAIVLTGYGWGNYLVGQGLSTAGLQMGLKLLMVPISITGLAIVILCLSFFPLHGNRWTDVQNKLTEKRQQSQ